MSYRCSCHKTLHVGLIALTLCLSGASLQTHAQDNDSASKPVTPATTSANNAPTSVVMPPTSTRPTTALAMQDTAPPPHPILLPPPPDDPAPAPKVAVRKPAPAKKVNPAPTPATVTAPAPAAATTPAAAATTPAAAAITPAPPISAAAVPAAQSAPSSPTPQQDAAIPSATVPQPDSAALTQGADTFGFYAGETKAQVLAAIGKDNLLKQSGDILEVAASPKPDPNFESFLLIVGPQQGLVKLIATGKDIDGDAAGHQMKEQFTALKTTLGQGYGDPSDNFDFLDAKATHRSPNQFMLSLTNSERTLAVYWTKKDFGNQITSISINGNGLGSEKGYLSLEYEFAGYHAYLLAKK